MTHSFESLQESLKDLWNPVDLQQVIVGINNHSFGQKIPDAGVTQDQSETGIVAVAGDALRRRNTRTPADHTARNIRMASR